MCEIVATHRCIITNGVISRICDACLRQLRYTFFHSAALPRRTGRTPEEIVGYDERGLPR
jgi:hypothetical protein